VDVGVRHRRQRVAPSMFFLPADGNLGLFPFFLISNKDAMMINTLIDPNKVEIITGRSILFEKMEIRTASKNKMERTPKSFFMIINV
jgi:hypothetical protein